MKEKELNYFKNQDQLLKTDRGLKYLKKRWTKTEILADGIPILRFNSFFFPNVNWFREPFVGGGSIFVYLKQKYPSKYFWINDIYKNLYHFWNECKESPNELIESILEFRSNYPDGKELHRFLLNNIDSIDSIHKAAAFFIFNRITFSGTTESGGFSNAAFHKRFTESSIERVKSLSRIL